MDQFEHSTEVCPCHPMRPNHTCHKYRPSFRKPHHASPRKSPTSSFPSSALTVAWTLNTSRYAIALLSAATGSLPAATIFLPMSFSGPIHNTTYSSPTSFDPRLCPPGFHQPAKSPFGPQPTAGLCRSLQGSSCTNSGVDSPTWKNSILSA